MPEPARSSPGTLVLLHGLGRTARSMHRLASEGARRGYRVRTIGYPSRRAGILAHAERVGLALSALPDHGPLHAVTHSRGGPEVIAQTFHFLEHGGFDRQRRW